MIYEVRVRGSFNAMHQLPLPGGGLEPIHGHDWVAEAVFRGPELDAAGMLVDFVAVRRTLDEALEKLEHANLNDRLPETHRPPSAENVARWVFDELQHRLETPPAGVYLTEAPGCIAGYVAPSTDS